jgi:hypothetical protein
MARHIGGRPSRAAGKSGKQAASAMNASLSWLLLFEAERHDDGLAASVDATTSALQRRFKMWLTIRTPLSINTSICTLYIPWEIATSFRLPPLRIQVFPW